MWASILFFLVMLPGNNMPSLDLWDVIPFDKFAHFFFFTVLTLLMVIGFSKQYSYRYLREHPVASSIVITLLYGLIIEVVQIMVPGRMIEYLDMLANISGTIMGLIVFILIYRV